LASQHEAVQANLVALAGSEVPMNKSNRLRYACNCNNYIWGKPALKIQCLYCQSQFEADEPMAVPARSVRKGA
jgi:hypothetical protein